MTAAGDRFRKAVEEAKTQGLPLHIIGVADGSDALEAQKAGFKAIYLSGSQMAASRGWADIGRLELRHVLGDVEKIMDSGVQLPLLVDIDTGFDDIAQTIRLLEDKGVAAVHVEDQQDLKFCGHLPGKHVVSREDATARIARAVGARQNGMVIMARTDALASEGMEKTLERIRSYSHAGADMIFAEAFPDPATYAAVKKAAEGKPVLANMTEFGKVKLQTPAQLQADSGGAVDIVLNPLTVYRAQRHTAAQKYEAIRRLGTQSGMEPELQTREDFQDLIGYKKQIEDRTQLLAKGKKPGG